MHVLWGNDNATISKRDLSWKKNIRYPWNEKELIEREVTHTGIYTFCKIVKFQASVVLLWGRGHVVHEIQHCDLFLKYNYLYVGIIF